MKSIVGSLLLASLPGTGLGALWHMQQPLLVLAGNLLDKCLNVLAIPGLLYGARRATRPAIAHMHLVSRVWLSEAAWDPTLPHCSLNCAFGLLCRGAETVSLLHTFPCHSVTSSIPRAGRADATLPRWGLRMSHDGGIQVQQDPAWISHAGGEELEAPELLCACGPRLGLGSLSYSLSSGSSSWCKGLDTSRVRSSLCPKERAGNGKYSWIARERGGLGSSGLDTAATLGRFHLAGWLSSFASSRCLPAATTSSLLVLLPPQFPLLALLLWGWRSLEQLLKGRASSLVSSSSLLGGTENCFLIV